MINAVSTSPFNLFLLRKKNVWYSVCDGNWSNSNTWISNSLDRKNITTPQIGDTVYIAHNITLDQSFHVKNIYITGSLIANGAVTVTLTIDGDCQVWGNGLINLQAQFHNLVLNGYNNSIPYTCFNGGSYSTVTYNGVFDQAILNIPYRNLNTTGYNGTKYLKDNVTVAGNFNMQSNFDCKSANFTVNGSSTIGAVGSGNFKSSGDANLIFVGSVDFEGNTDLSVGNPTIEFRGGLTIHTYFFESGTGNISFTTNNQSINSSAYLGTGKWSASTTIVGAITVTLTGGSVFPLNNTINGTVAGSIFNNSGSLYLYTSVTPMATGVFNYQFTTSSALGYVFTGNYTLPYSSYANLVTDGTGTKKLGANTVVNQSFVVSVSTNAANCAFDCAGYNLTVNGNFTNHGQFICSSFCNLLFIGLATFAADSTTTSYVDLRTGNPNIEFRSGLTVSSNGTYTGTGVFTFSTNNQTWDMQINNGGLWAANTLISGAITVTYLDGSSNQASEFYYGTLNGNNADSTFINKGNFNYQNAQQPMQTGKLLCNQAANTFVYGLAGNQDITVPGDATPGYQNLMLNNSGSKRLLGNVSVKGTYTLTSPATLNSNGFVLANP